MFTSKPKLFASIMVVAIAIGLAVITKAPESWFYTDFKSTPRPQGGAAAIQDPDPEKDGIQKETVKFSCRTNSTVSIQEMWRCHAWLYTPIKQLSLQNKNKQFPVIIMAHGLGSTKDMGLHKFARHFAKNGFIVLLFDYLHFGLSDGYPRHEINPFQHVRDYESAIQYVQRNENVDGRRIGLWGTSYAGGHVLVTAAKQNVNIKAVISQMPFLGPTPGENAFDEILKRGIDNVVKAIFGAFSSKVRRQLGMTPLYARLYGHVGDSGKLALNYWEKFDGDEKQWLQKHPKNRENDWRNTVMIESMMAMIKYKPIQYIDKIDTQNTKVLLIKAKMDKLCPNNRVDYVIEKLQCESHMVDSTHFGMYDGEAFNQHIEVQIDFFKKNLKHKNTLKVLD